MYSVRHYDWVIHLTAIAVCSFFISKMVTTYVGGALETLPEAPVVELADAASSSSSTVADVEGSGLEEAENPYQIILDRNIFNSAESATASVSDEGEVDPAQLGDLGPAVKTNLNVKLLGTLVVGDGTDRRSSAVVSGDKSKSGETYYPGDEESFGSNVRLTKVEPKRIEFVNGSRLEFLEIEDFVKRSIFASVSEVHGAEAAKSESSEEKKSGASSSDPDKKIVLDQKEIDQALQNLDKLATDVRIVPNFKDGKPAGMKVLSVKPGSVIAKLGVRRGDILEKVNGQELDIQKGMDLFGSLKDMKNFSLDVVRGGKNQTLEYEIR